MKHGYSNNSGGGTQPKTGRQYTPLCRKNQYESTMKAMDNKTRSGHSAGKENNLWKGAGEGQGGNVHGYHPE